MDSRNKKNILDEAAGKNYEKSSILPKWAVSLIIGAGISVVSCSNNDGSEKTTVDKTPDDRSSSMRSDSQPVDMKIVAPLYAAPVMNTEPVRKDPLPPQVTEYGVRTPNE